MAWGKRGETLEANTERNKVSFDLSYYNEVTRRNTLAQYIRTFSILPGRPPMTYDLNDCKKISGFSLQKGTKEYNEDSLKYVGEHLEEIQRVADRLERLLGSINVDYIKAHVATQKLIFDANEKDDINSKVIDEFFKEQIKPESSADKFLTIWLKNFEIGNAIKIEHLEGEGYYVKIDTDNANVHLADMGMGNIQLIILLLRLATILNRVQQTGQRWVVVVEEPEQNLHPKLQSQLADMFYDFSIQFAYYEDRRLLNKLIIESHSEYLVRRTQVMVAESAKDSELTEEELQEMNPFKVFYFPTGIKEQPYDMEYLPSGRFKQSFGYGFYDAAGKLALDLYRKEEKTQSDEVFNWNI